VALLRRSARERGGPLTSIDAADTLLDERSRATRENDHRGSPGGRSPRLSLSWVPED
jgi:hypothetical protein